MKSNIDCPLNVLILEDPYVDVVIRRIDTNKHGVSDEKDRNRGGDGVREEERECLLVCW